MPPASSREDAPATAATVAKFAWQVTALSQVFGQMRGHWARVLRITSPQWLIMNAIFELDRGQGVPVKDVAKRIFVDPSFITTQTKILEKQGFVRRRVSKADARVVEMSLTDRAAKRIESLADMRQSTEEAAFSGLNDAKVSEIVREMAGIAKRLEQALRQYPDVPEDE